MENGYVALTMEKFLRACERGTPYLYSIDVEKGLLARGNSFQ